MEYGDPPFFLVFYRARSRRHGYDVMLCPLKNFRKLRRLTHGFSDPDHYGRTVCKLHSNDALEMLQAILKARYDFDLDIASLQHDQAAAGVFPSPRLF